MMTVFPSRATAIVAFVFFLLAAGTTAAHEVQGVAPKSIFTKHFQETLFDITDHASYSVEVLLNDKEYKIGKDVIGIVVHDKRDGDVKGASLSIVLKNLITGEKAPDAPVVMDKGNGLYIISNLNLNREGRWELRITVGKKGVVDHVKFILPDALKNRVPKGRYSP
jgi:hypothetical protein